MHRKDPSWGDTPISFHPLNADVSESGARENTDIRHFQTNKVGNSHPNFHFTWNPEEDLSDPFNRKSSGYAGIREPCRIRVLYVDDEPDLLDIGKMFLERSGIITIETAESVKEGLRCLSSRPLDVIVSDYQMDGMDGIQFLKEIRSTGNPTPFIIFTGKGREEVVIEALNEGADFYLQKGGEPQSQFAELEHKICQAYRRHHAERKLLESRSLLTTVFESIIDGILVFGSNKKILAWNGTFLTMFQLPQKVLQTRDPESVLEKIFECINNPESFYEHITLIGHQPDYAGRDIFETCDGRYIEWYSHPYLFGEEVIGRILSFRDVTARYSKVSE